MALDDVERDLFDALYFERSLPIREKYEADLKKIDYQKHLDYLDTLKKFACEEDDEHNKGALTDFRKHLSAEVRAHRGEELIIFQDKEHIERGQNWRRRIEEAIGGTTFLIPVITPNFFSSKECRDEVEKFLVREKELGRNDLILPLYFIDTPLMNDRTKRANDALAEEIASRQYADWRSLRFELFTSPLVRKELEKLAIQIRNALERTEAQEKG